MAVCGNGWEIVGLRMVGLASDWVRVGVENPLIWRLSEEDSKQKTLGPLFAFCWQMDRWLMVRQSGPSFCGPTENDNFPTNSQRWHNQFVLRGKYTSDFFTYLFN